MLREKGNAKLDEDICVHIFTASAGMVGVCITVIGIFQVITTLWREATLGDDIYLEYERPLCQPRRGPTISSFFPSGFADNGRLAGSEAD